jgi:hypothetical protein
MEDNGFTTRGEQARRLTKCSKRQLGPFHSLLDELDVIELPHRQQKLSSLPDRCHSRIPMPVCFAY